MEVQGHVVGVCSWSLRPRDLTDLIEKVRETELSHVQLALGPLLALPADARDSALGTLHDAGIELTAAMISYPGEDYSTISTIRRSGGLVPDALWAERKELTLRAAEMAKSLGLKALTTHIGFIPLPHDESYTTVVGRLQELIRPLADMGLNLLMETGQEPADELLQFLNNLHARNLGINFDPANMILYGSGDPVDAVVTLGKHIRHVHVKDAVKSANPGIEWGTEVAFGDGDVPHAGFLAALHQVGYTGPLVIERESGSDRTADVRYAIETLAGL